MARFKTHTRSWKDSGKENIFYFQQIGHRRGGGPVISEALCWQSVLNGNTDSLVDSEVVCVKRGFKILGGRFGILNGQSCGESNQEA